MLGFRSFSEFRIRDCEPVYMRVVSLKHSSPMDCQLQWVCLLSYWPSACALSYEISFVWDCIGHNIWKKMSRRGWVYGVSRAGETSFVLLRNSDYWKTGGEICSACAYSLLDEGSKCKSACHQMATSSVDRPRWHHVHHGS